MSERRIRELNDAFRTTFSEGRVMLTAGVNQLPPETKAAVLRAVRTFSEFTCENDPHGEHDFGAFSVGDERFFWKIDYFDVELEYGLEDHSDPAQTTRVLTIMLSHEY